MQIKIKKITQKVEKKEVVNPTFEENLENKKKVINKVHLPVLNLNIKEEWESLPLSKRRHLTDELAQETCGSNCCGYEGLAAACCQLNPENLEHVLGAITKEDISRILKQLKKSIPSIEKSDIVIEKEEGMLIGRTFFNGHDIFNQENSYPMLRFQIYQNRFVCKFLNPKTKQCSIYSVRPEMCKNYFCRYVKTNFLLRTPSNPNIYKKID